MGTRVIRMAKEGYEIGTTGMKDISSGQMIVGNLTEDDLDYGSESTILGNGASGYVYLATHKHTGQKMALKSINVFEKGKRHQLVNDLRSLQKAGNCPFLVQFLGAMYEEGAVKVALEYMDMGSLVSLHKLALKKNGRAIEEGRPLIPEAVMAKIIQQILSGLSYLNIVLKQMHRDIKPDNILINKRGQVKLTDFGISKQITGDETEKARTFVGTLTYMSPERMEGEKYSYAGDLWSLGITLIELVTGKFPFRETKGFLEMLEQIAELTSPNVPNNGNFTPEL
jgi:serine/threonine protein kinase